MSSPLAFPGAEGGGRFTQGGRGGAVCEVTNLNDNGPGSLREAIDASGPRTVVFRVSGTIALESELKIDSPYITIAGQTAPGDGICIRNYRLSVKANDVIIRYIRFRLGDTPGGDQDAIWGRYYKNIILDHCSASWSVDESLSFYANDSLTVQWCIVSESLYGANHPKGAHGYGGIWGGRDAAFHHNLIAHHSSRTPRFAGGETAACENVDFRNNVIYNWGFNSAYGGERGAINMVANYYKAGPATKSSKQFRIVEPYDSYGKWYVEENVVEGSETISQNNWAGGVQGSHSSESVVRAYEPFPFSPVVTQSAEEAYELVLEQAGVNYSNRDTVDKRIIHDTRTGTATFDGATYEINQGFSDTSVVRGIIDSQTQVGGWPELLSLTPPADEDHDGMADDWEIDHSLDPGDDSDRNLTDASGYTQLEKYLNSLVETPVTSIEPIAATISSGFVLNQNYPNPFNPNTTLSFSIPDAGRIRIHIYDGTGRLIDAYASTMLSAGAHQFEWDGKNKNHQDVPTGIYLGEVRFNNHRQTIKMQLIR